MKCTERFSHQFRGASVLRAVFLGSHQLPSGGVLDSQIFERNLVVVSCN